jgi:DNA (cytosine-5)-methyltransferase 1
MRFIDLFSGLGGFHVALTKLGHECVFACEINEDLRKVYEKNFNMHPEGDIREVKIEEIPQHEILCAGFPCQPFSKAGDQTGFKCPKQGDLFDYVHAILEYHMPDYFLLENVPNLLRHDEGRTWNSIRNRLISLEYSIDYRRLSPHNFGIPQIRDRVYIVGSKSGLEDFVWPEPQNVATSILSAIEKEPADAKPLSQQVIDCLNVWQQFISLYPKDVELPSFPIWAMEFGADYPFEDRTPYAIGAKELAHYHGSMGIPLGELKEEHRFDGLPSYARTKEDRFPDWKIRFIKQNRELYMRNKNWIDSWLPLIKPFPPSLQKLEWNCKGEERDIWKYIIQFRASGVRVKRTDTSPSLVAMTTTQVPIVAWEKRYMTPRECANLQSLGDLTYLPESPNKAFKALGNAVNAKVVQKIMSNLVRE